MRVCVRARVISNSRKQRAEKIVPIFGNANENVHILCESQQHIFFSQLDLAHYASILESCFFFIANFYICNGR